MAAFELIAAWGRGQDWLPDIPGVSILAATSGAEAGAFSGAVVSAAATLLGLYYATVGVVASTVYRDVPADIRALFIRDRSGEVYIRALVRIITAGLAVLAASALRYNVSGLVLALLVLLALVSVVWLVNLGRRLFGFFNPAHLGSPVAAELRAAFALASRTQTRTSHVAQSDAQARARESLRVLRGLAVLLRTSSLRDGDGPALLTAHLVRAAREYARVKNGITPDSEWWMKARAHLNWFELDDFRLRVSIAQVADFPGEQKTNFLWVESQISEALMVCFEALHSTGEHARAIFLSRQIVPLAHALGAQMQVDEIREYDAVNRSALTAILTAGGDAVKDKNIIAATADALVTPVHAAYEGLAQAAAGFAESDLRGAFDTASVRASTVLQGYPIRVRQRIEELREGLDAELRIEGERVTGRWWTDHQVARALAVALVEAEDSISSLIRERTFSLVSEHASSGRAEAAAAIAFSSLQLFADVGEREAVFAGAHEALKRFRSAAVDQPEWPVRTANELSKRETHMEMLTFASALMPRLRSPQFDPDNADAYGRTYQLAVDGMFESLFAGNLAAAVGLHRAVFAEREALAVRRTGEAAGKTPPQRRAAMAEHLVALMEFGGYALLLRDLGLPSPWEDVSQIWDEATRADDLLPAQALTDLTVVDNTFGLWTAAVTARFQRVEQFLGLLRRRGVDIPERGEWASDRSPDVGDLASAYLLARDFGPSDNAPHVFLVEYLRARLPQEAKLGDRALFLLARIERARNNE